MVDFTARAQELAPELIELRRELHQNPELDIDLPWTSARMAEEMDKLGIPYVRVGEDSLVGTIGGKKPGKAISIRADMDGLPVVEETGLPFASTNGNMHACGHDGHMTMGVGAMKMLKEVEDELEGTVYMSFQSAEETGRGAIPIINYLKEQGGIDQSISIHLWAGVPSGKMSLVEGPRMAGAGNIHITVHGVGGHGSRPDLAVDPIKPACQIALAISSIPTNFVSTLHPAVIHVGSIQAGNAGNVFPPTAVIKGGYRFFLDEDRDTIIETVNRMATSIAEAYGATAEVAPMMGIVPLQNHGAAVERGQKVMDEMGTLTNDPFEQICASENYGLFVDEWEGFMGYLGVMKEGKEQFYQHHPKFDIDEDVLPLGAEFFARYAYDYLAGKLD